MRNRHKEAAIDVVISQQAASNAVVLPVLVKVVHDAKLPAPEDLAHIVPTQRNLSWYRRRSLRIARAAGGAHNEMCARLVEQEDRADVGGRQMRRLIGQRLDGGGEIEGRIDGQGRIVEGGHLIRLRQIAGGGVARFIGQPRVLQHDCGRARDGLEELRLLRGVCLRLWAGDHQRSQKRLAADERRRQQRGDRRVVTPAQLAEFGMGGAFLGADAAHDLPATYRMPPGGQRLWRDGRWGKWCAITLGDLECRLLLLGVVEDQPEGGRVDQMTHEIANALIERGQILRVAPEDLEQLALALALARQFGDAQMTAHAVGVQAERLDFTPAEAV